MRREVLLDEISDGKLYRIHDMVKADCQECKGCSSCCRGMGESIVLDPLDIWRLKYRLGESLQELMQHAIELNVVDHMILPNLKMNTETEACSFLNQEGRCSIHTERPGICRIFPLGRVYENRSFQYFLQMNECEKTNRTKIKVSKWIDCKHMKENQKFISQWHYFLKDVEELILESQEENALKQVSMYVLQQFYVQDIVQSGTLDTNELGFYEEMEQRILRAREGLGLSMEKDGIL